MGHVVGEGGEGRERRRVMQKEMRICENDK